MSSIRSGFRYDINTLRAIAVIGVILFHYHVPFFDGGFSGVDIFFVISGYLMTRIILTGLEKNTFNLLDFYNKRSLRIVPALLFLVITTICITFFVYLPADYQVVTKNAGASILFYSNILYSHSDYFDTSSDNNMFLHTWSLSVEWQFYLLLPIILMLVNKILKNDRKKYLLFFITATFFIFLAAVYIHTKKPTDAFYFLPTRSWEMLAGGIAFLLEGRIRSNISKYTSIIGYIVLLAGFVFLKETMAWPGFYTLLPVAGTFLIIVSNHNEFKILHAKSIAYLGTISYSLYLWHWPVIVFANYIGIQLNAYSIVSYIVISFILAVISYNYIENYKNIKINYVRIGIAVMALITGLFTYKSINSIAFKKTTLEIANYRLDHIEESIKQLSRYTCFINSEGTGMKNFNKEKCLYIDTNKKNYVLIGDSHAAHFSQSLKESLAKYNINIIQATASGCTAVYKPNGLTRCNEIINFMYYDFIPKNASHIDGVIISSDWENNPDAEDLVVQLHKTIEYIQSMKIPVILLGQNPTYTIPYTSIAAREYEYNASFSDRYIDPASTEINKVMANEFKDLYVNIFNFGICPKLSPANVPYMSDQNHFTKYGADCVTNDILKNVQFKKFAGLEGKTHYLTSVNTK